MELRPFSESINVAMNAEIVATNAYKVDQYASPKPSDIELAKQIVEAAKIGKKVVTYEGASIDITGQAISKAKDILALNNKSLAMVKKVVAWITKHAGVKSSMRSMALINSALMKFMGPIWTIDIADDIYKFLASNPGMMSNEMLMAFEAGQLNEEDMAKIKTALSLLRDGKDPKGIKDLLFTALKAAKSAKEKGEILAIQRMDAVNALLRKGENKEEATKIVNNVIPHGEFYHKDVGWY